MDSNTTTCLIMIWSDQAANALKLPFYICVIAASIHLLFWLNMIAYPTVRQRSMQWLYAYLGTDLFLLLRFFFLYVYRWWPLCIPNIVRIIICYCEAILDTYLNLLQSFILLALNICRYIQIVRNHDVYVYKQHMMIVIHFLVYILPLLYYIVSILCHWFILYRPYGDACDVDLASIAVQISFLTFSYLIPVSLTLIFLLLSLKFVRNTNGIQTEQIIIARLKYHRRLVIQSSVFYSLWLTLWSPYLLVFSFYRRNTIASNITQILSYISIALDPIVIAALDVRFLRAWHTSWNHLMRFLRPARVAPIGKEIVTNCQLNVQK
ncbi:hypothetical protein I4U23_018106 [Adineta vaga]|nr:hypothetical protein I4U23_018106 [Adineta vaga]